jgi:hypothetical protein
MPLRPPAGFISANYDPLRNPDAPTGVTAAAGNTQATVLFTAPANVGGSAISAYYAVSNPSQITVSGASSPITVTGLTNGTAYTFQVWALNTFGPGAFSAASGSVTPVNARGLFAGGFRTAASNIIDYVTITTLGNATDFGDLTTTMNAGAACSSQTIGVFTGESNTVAEKVTILTTGNATTFGSPIQPTVQGATSSCSNSTRGLLAGAYTITTYWNVINYITFASAGSTTSFGTLTIQRGYGGGVASSTRGVFGCGGYVSGSFISTNVIDYITIATTGNATDFGDMSAAIIYEYGACSNSTRGVFAGGLTGSVTNTIEYITIATTGNATDFGDLTVARRSMGACASSLRGIFGGGYTTTPINVIDYITIATVGNAIDFGDLTTNASSLTSCSNAHGGL